MHIYGRKIAPYIRAAKDFLSQHQSPSIWLCVIMFVMQLLTSLSGDLLLFAFIPDRFVQGQGVLWPSLTLLTYAFVHTGSLHMILNITSLFVFGLPTEKHLRPLHFIGLFMVSSALGALVHVSIYGYGVSLLGASAGISGIIGAWCRLTSWNGPILFVIAVSWILVNFLLNSATGTTAWEAHCIGFLFGLFGLPLLLSFGKQRR